ncbi:MAG: hypothetical protein RL710_1098 [Pseudomonadota bacterium]|jgi:hypothetical protein
MYDCEQNLIAENGLRYKAKVNGSPFRGTGGSGETMSCIKCGNHRLRSHGAIRRFLNSPMFFCFDCKPVKVAEPQN